MTRPQIVDTDRLKPTPDFGFDAAPTPLRAGRRNNPTEARLL